MGWNDIYLCCLLIGVGLSVAAVVSGSMHGSVLHGGDGALSHLGHLTHPAALGHSSSVADAGGGHGLPVLGSLFQFGTVAAGFSWFGATGYILMRVARFEWWVTSFLAACGGVAGAALLLTFVRQVLLAHDPTLDRRDYVLIGALVTVSTAIRERGTGEVVVSQPAGRYWTAARSSDGTPLCEGTLVVVLEHNDGIATVTRWDGP